MTKERVDGSTGGVVDECGTSGTGRYALGPGPVSQFPGELVWVAEFEKEMVTWKSRWNDNERSSFNGLHFCPACWPDLRPERRQCFA